MLFLGNPTQTPEERAAAAVWSINIMIRLMDIKGLSKSMLLNRSLSLSFMITASILIGINIVYYRTLLLYALAIICFIFAAVTHLETKIDAIRLELKK